MRSWTSRILFLCLAAAAALWISGCLSAKYLAMVRYDEPKDEFHILNVYQRIAAGTPDDAEYLYQVWRNRDHLIRVPNIDIFGMPAFIRISPTRYAPINLGASAAKLEPVETAVSLAEIRISPGTFFLRGPDTLCYYDQVVIPGKVIDQALPEFTKAAAPAEMEDIDKELQRRKDGGKRDAWDVYRRQIVEAVHSAAHPTTAPATEPDTQPAEERADLLKILNDDTLQLLRKDLAQGGLEISRHKQVFGVIIPLSDADVQQAKESWNALFDTIKGDTAKAAEGSQVAVAAKLLSAFSLSAHPQAVEIRIDLAVVLAKIPEIAASTAALDEPKPEDLKSMQDAIAALRAHQVPIDEKLTIEQLAKDFLADSVKSYPSEHPVEPGSGLVQPQGNPVTAPPEKK